MSARSVPPSSYNLLELYRQHRDEIDAITDPTTLFILAFTNRQNGVQLDELAGDLGLSPTALRAKITPLVRAQLASESTNQLTVTPLGKRVLDELGFALPPAPTDLPERGEPPRKPPQPPTTTGTPGWLWGIIAFLGTAAVMLVGAIIIGSAVLPGIFNPPTPTPIPFPTATPVLPRPEVQIEFVADRTRLEMGECTLLRWQVVGGFGVTLNHEPVNRRGETQVCPRESTTYELAVDVGDSMKRNAIVISVVPIAAPEPTRTFTPTPSRIPTSTPTITRTFTPTPTPTRTRTPTPVVISLTPVADAHIISGSCASGNFNGAELAVAGKSGDPDCPGTVRALIRFPTLPIPPGKVIQNATLNAFVKSSAPGSTTIQISMILKSWNETTVTWNNQPDHFGNYASIPVSNTGWHTWNVLIPVLEWYNNKTENNGLMLLNTAEGSATFNWRTFHSRESPSTSLRPYLAITYLP